MGGSLDAIKRLLRGRGKNLMTKSFFFHQPFVLLLHLDWSNLFLFSQRFGLSIWFIIHLLVLHNFESLFGLYSFYSLYRLIFCTNSLLSGGIEKLIMMDTSYDMVKMCKEAEQLNGNVETSFLVGDEEFLPVKEKYA